jgi:hypothetical protein
VQMSNERDESLPRSKSAADELPPTDSVGPNGARLRSMRCLAASPRSSRLPRYDLTVDELLSWQK